MQRDILSFCYRWKVKWNQLNYKEHKTNFSSGHELSIYLKHQYHTMNEWILLRQTEQNRTELDGKKISKWKRSNINHSYRTLFSNVHNMGRESKCSRGLESQHDLRLSSPGIWSSASQEDFRIRKKVEALWYLAFVASSWSLQTLATHCCKDEITNQTIP